MLKTSKKKNPQNFEISMDLRVIYVFSPKAFTLGGVIYSGQSAPIRLFTIEEFRCICSNSEREVGTNNWKDSLCAISLDLHNLID